MDDSNGSNNNDLPSIEDKMDREMINVRDIDHPIEKSEWNRRTKLYEKRLSRINKPLLLRSTLMSETLEEGLYPFIVCLLLIFQLSLN